MEVIKEFFDMLANLLLLCFMCAGIIATAYLIIKYRIRQNRHTERRRRVRAIQREKLRKEGLYEDEIDDILEDY